jgi:hypothetical protein
LAEVATPVGVTLATAAVEVVAAPVGATVGAAVEPDGAVVARLAVGALVTVGAKVGMAAAALVAGTLVAATVGSKVASVVGIIWAVAGKAVVPPVGGVAAGVVPVWPAQAVAATDSTKPMNRFFNCIARYLPRTTFYSIPSEMCRYGIRWTGRDA